MDPPAVTPMLKRIRVLIVDDSASIRELLVRVFGADEQLDVVGTAHDGQEAVAMTARLRPDVVTMDLHLPKLNGVLATQRIMAETPTPIVVISSSVEQKEVGLAFDALQAGAVSVLEKPPGPDHPRHAAAIREIVTAVRVMAQVKVVRRWATPARRPPLRPRPPSRRGHCRARWRPPCHRRSPDASGAAGRSRC